LSSHSYGGIEKLMTEADHKDKTQIALTQ
jgi:hypothetical protein